MNKGDIITLAQIGILALLIYSFQVIFEAIESAIGLSGNWNFVALIINPIIATVIITVIYVFWLSRPMPKIIIIFSVLMYIAIQFVSSNVFNALDLQKTSGTIFPWIYLSLGLSVVIFTVMYFILTSTIDLTSKIMRSNKKATDEISMKRISVTVPRQKKPKFSAAKTIPKVEIYKDELPKIGKAKAAPVKTQTKKATTNKIAAKKKQVKKVTAKKTSKKKKR
jgi:hypothetical protein